MEIKIKKNIEQLKEIIKLVGNVNIEVDFVFCPEGLIIQTACPAAISMIIIKINKNFFEEYIITKENICTFQLDALSKIIKRVGKKEMQIKFDDTKVLFISEKDEFSLKYFVGKKDNRPEPQINNKSQWHIKSSELFDIIKEFESFSEVIKIKSKNNKLHFYTKSALIEGTSFTNALPIVQKDDYSWYALPNFLMIAPITKIFKTLKIQFENDRPCEITGKTELIKFKWVLAPRVE